MERVRGEGAAGWIASGTLAELLYLSFFSVYWLRGIVVRSLYWECSTSRQFGLRLGLPRSDSSLPPLRVLFIRFHLLCGTPASIHLLFWSVIYVLLVTLKRIHIHIRSLFYSPIILFSFIDVHNINDAPP